MGTRKRKYIDRGRSYSFYDIVSRLEKRIWHIAILVVIFFLIVFGILVLPDKVTTLNAEKGTGIEEQKQTLPPEQEEFDQQENITDITEEKDKEEQTKIVQQPTFSFADYPKNLMINDVLDGFIVISKDASPNLRKAAVELNGKLTALEKSKSDELEIGVDYGGGVGREWPATSCKDLDILCGGTTYNKHGRYKYTQTLFNPVGRVEFRVNPDDDHHTPRPYYHIQQGNETYRYKINFMPSVKTIHKTVGGKGRVQLDEFARFGLNIFGKDYLFVDSRHPQKERLKLILIGGLSDVLAEGEEKIYEIDGEAISISPIIITTNKVIFRVNGKNTDSMGASDNDQLDWMSNRTIAVHELMENEAEETDGRDRVKFYFGDTIILEDQNTSAPSTLNNNSQFVGSLVTFNNQHLPQVDVSIVTTRDQGAAAELEVLLKSVEVKYLASDDLYGWGKLSKIAEDIEKEPNNFLNFFEYEYLGLQSLGDPTKQFIDEYVFHPRGKRNFKLKWRNKHGHWYDHEVAACTNENCDNIRYGKLSSSTFYDLEVSETAQISENEYFFLSAETWPHLMKFDKIDKEDDVLHIRDMYDHDGEDDTTYEVSYTNASGVGYLDLDEATFRFNVSETTDNITVDMNGDGDMVDTGITFRAKSNGDFTFSDTIEPQIQYRTNELFEDTRRDDIGFEPYWHPTRKRLDINESSITGDWLFGFNSSLPGVIVNRTIEINKSDTVTGMTEFGLRGELSKADSDQQSNFTILAPRYQEFGFVQVYPTTWKSLVRIDEGFAEKTISHIIFIGGPCENKKTKELMETADEDVLDCTLGLSSGESMIKLYPNSIAEGKHAVVVAGYDDEATMDALKVLKDPEKYAFKERKTKEIKVKKEKDKLVVI